MPRLDAVRSLVSLGFAQAVLWAAVPAAGAPITFSPVTVTQPDGTEVSLFASGDEFFNYLHDADEYTIMQDPDTGWYVYAEISGGRIYPTTLVAGRDDPRGGGLSPRELPAPALREVTAAQFPSPVEAGFAPMPVAPPPNSGTLINVVFFIRFSDDTEFTTPLSTYDTALNSNTPGVNSLYNYYKEVSYGQLDINSKFVPDGSSVIVSYQDPNPRSYYKVYNASTNPNGYQGETQRREREHALLKAAAEAGAAGLPTGVDFDTNNDGLMDSVQFVVKGNAEGWAELLWAHRWVLYTYTTQINGLYVWDYNLIPESQFQVGVLCHEMFHTLSAPDLYRYYNSVITPVGAWDVMATTSNPPAHPGAYMKWKWGKWLDSIPEITPDGSVRTLQPVTSETGQSVIVRAPDNRNEYYVLEYRRDTGLFESAIPGSGLLVYRINGAVGASFGNAYGPPDSVYVFRPGGTLTANGTLSTAHFSQETGRTTMTASTNPYPFWSSSIKSCLKITDVGSAGADISFKVSLDTTMEACMLGDGTDNDGDGKIDCDDPDLRANPAYEGCRCADGIDNDGDGTVDCADTDCSGQTTKEGPCRCADSTDNDGDGKVDCLDPDCANTATCAAFTCEEGDLGGAVTLNAAVGTTSGGDSDVNPASACASGFTSGRPDTLFRWTAPFTGNFTFDTESSYMDTVLMVYDGCGGTVLACDNNSGTGNGSGSGNNSRVTLNITANTRLVIAVDGYNSSGTYALNISAACTPDCTGKQCGGDGCGGSCGTCSDGNACTQDSCNGSNQCVFDAPPMNGQACDDGQFCTAGETCNAGNCEGGGARDCSAQTDQCNVGECNETTDACVKNPVPKNGNACDDGLYCKQNEVCVSGACTGTDIDCSGLDDECNAGVCDEGTDACKKDPAPKNGNPCDDGLFCTDNDACAAGSCTGAAKDCSAISGQCAVGTCNEATDQCDVDPAPKNGFPCNDGAFCTVGEICASGVCGGGGARDCSGATDQCNVGVCDDVNDICKGDPGPKNGNACNDNLFCTVNDACANGACTGGARDCSAQADQCNAGACNETTDQCVKDPAPKNGQSCGDGLFCTVSDTCANGSCSGGARDCSGAGHQCAVGQCNETADQCEPNPTPKNGQACDDGQFCTTGETCSTGTCGNGAARDCSAFTNQCNVGVCDEAADSCKGDPSGKNGQSCNDALFCTVNDACASGTCTGAARDCSAQADACNAGACNESTDQCVKDPGPKNGQNCDDGKFCTVNDVCTSGTCDGVGRNCSDGKTCTTDSCNEGTDQCDNILQAGRCLIAGGCVDANQADPTEPCRECNPAQSTSAYVNKNNGTPCGGDAFSCTNDVCQSGTCTHTVAQGCLINNLCISSGGINPANPCQACLPATSTSAWSNRPDTSPCDDGKFCTVGDACAAGVCTGGAPKDCSSVAGACTVGACNETLKTCEAKPKVAGSACGNPQTCVSGLLTAGDSCDAAGFCVPGTTASCAPYAGCASGNACLTGCTSNAQCAPGAACLNGKCKGNQAPVASAGAKQTVGENEKVVLDGSGCKDADNDPLTFTWSQLDGPDVILSSATARSPNFTSPPVLFDTELTFQVVVTDGVLTSAPAVTSVIVKNSVNEPPLAFIRAPTSVREGDFVTLDGDGSSDPNDEPLSFTWTQESGPPVTFSKQGLAIVDFTAPKVMADTTLVFTLVVNDGKASSAPAKATVKVKNVFDDPLPVADDAGLDGDGGDAGDAAADGGGDLTDGATPLPAGDAGADGDGGEGPGLADDDGGLAAANPGDGGAGPGEPADGAAEAADTGAGGADLEDAGSLALPDANLADLLDGAVLPDGAVIPDGALSSGALPALGAAPAPVAGPVGDPAVTGCACAAPGEGTVGSGLSGFWLVLLAAAWWWRRGPASARVLVKARGGTTGYAAARRFPGR